MQRTRQADNPFARAVEISHRFSNAKARTHEKFRMVPDGLFGLEYSLPAGKKLYRFFALEAERRNRVNTGSLKGSSFLKKVLACRAIIDTATHKMHFGVPNLLILTVAPTQARIETMKKTVLDLYGPGGSSIFLFRRIATQGYGERVEPPTSHVFCEPWQRAGSSDFHLDTQQAR